MNSGFDKFYNISNIYKWTWTYLTIEYTFICGSPGLPNQLSEFHPVWISDHKVELEGEHEVDGLDLFVLDRGHTIRLPFSAEDGGQLLVNLCDVCWDVGHGFHCGIVFLQKICQAPIRSPETSMCKLMWIFKQKQPAYELIIIWTMS